MLLPLILQGCGTLIPGSRLQVDVRKYCFSFDGGKVFYQEERYDYRILSEKSRDRYYVNMYDVEKRRHRRIARSALMEVSPSGPILYLGKDWKKKDSKDLYVYDYVSRKKAPVLIRGMDVDKPYISIAGIEWLSGGDIIAEIGLTSENPCEWVGKEEPQGKGRIIKRTLVIDDRGARIEDGGRELPGRKGYRLVSPDGRYQLKEDPFERYFMFHTGLYIEDRESGERIYITKDSRIMSFFEGMGYLFGYVGFGIVQALGIK